MFGRDQSGNVALLFGLMLPVMMVGVGGGIEVSRAVEYKQRLISAADLTCRQAELYVESQSTLPLSKDYIAAVQAYADKNETERSLSTTATITAVPTVSKAVLTTPPLSTRPGNVHVVATGSVALVFKSFLKQDSVSFTVTRDCTVSAAATTGPPNLLLSESFEGYIPQLNGGWGVFGTMSKANCQDSTCTGKSWGTTNAGVEVDQLSAVATGDGVQYGQAFAELDSDCGNRIGGTNSAQTTACKQTGQTTNSSINMTLNLTPGQYEVRYVYTARKNVGAYQYPNDAVICSDDDDTDGEARDTDVSMNAGVSTVTGRDFQTRRIELWVEPKSSGYKSDDQSLTIKTNKSYMKSYMADVCIWARTWVERKYTFKVTGTSTQEYRISWRAAGLDDSFGGLIDYLRICQNSCP